MVMPRLKNLRKSRRPQISQPVVTQQPSSYEATPKRMKETKEYNKELRYTQGFRQTIGAGATVPIEIRLNSPGIQLLGFSVIPLAASDISDAQATVNVNNNVVCKGVSIQNMNPNFVGSMVFFPTPQPLQGNDNISYDVTNNLGSSITITVNAFYVPRVG